MATNMTELHIYQDKKQQYRWRLVAGNGEIIGASSQGFSRKGSCEDNAILVQHGIRGALDSETNHAIVDDTDD